jgi:hypothetical protein
MVSSRSATTASNAARAASSLASVTCSCRLSRVSQSDVSRFESGRDALLPVARYLLEEAALRRGPSPEEADREAEQIWTALQGFPPARRRRLIELAPPPVSRSSRGSFHR